MISVIVPTMWKPQHMLRMLPMLDAHSLVGEIILIDNDTSKTNKEFLKTISKLNYWSFEDGNIFVNPAWNIGAKIAKYDKLFILNDDCLINLAKLDLIYDQITPENGMIGFSFLSYCTYTIEAFDSLSQSGFGEEISFEIIDPRMYPTRSGMPHPFYGSAYFTHKENYHVIPEDLKIHYGDLFNYVSNLKKGIHNYTIEDGLVMTNYSSTVSSISKDILNHEANIMKQVFEKHALTNIKYTIPN
jgi:hypothetical protein